MREYANAICARQSNRQRARRPRIRDRSARSRRQLAETTPLSYTLKELADGLVTCRHWHDSRAFSDGTHLLFEVAPQALDPPTASAFAGLLVAFGGALVKYYKSRTALPAPPVASVVPLAPSNLVQEPPAAA